MAESLNRASLYKLVAVRAICRLLSARGAGRSDCRYPNRLFVVMTLRGDNIVIGKLASLADILHLTLALTGSLSYDLACIVVSERGYLTAVKFRIAAGAVNLFGSFAEAGGLNRSDPCSVAVAESRHIAVGIAVAAGAGMRSVTLRCAGWCGNSGSVGMGVGRCGAAASPVLSSCYRHCCSITPSNNMLSNPIVVFPVTI